MVSFSREFFISHEFHSFIIFRKNSFTRLSFNVIRVGPSVYVVCGLKEVHFLIGIYINDPVTFPERGNGTVNWLIRRKCIGRKVCLFRKQRSEFGDLL